MNTIQVRDLSHHGSRLVKSVEDDGEEYEITRQGRPTGVVLTRRSRIGEDAHRQRRGASLDQVKHLYRRPLDPAVAQEQLEMIEQGRDASGQIGDA